MAPGPTGTGSKVLTLGLCGVAPAWPQRAKVTREPVACGGVWAMHPFDLLFNCLIVNNFAFFLIIVLFALFIFLDIKLIWFIILCWDVVQL